MLKIEFVLTIQLITISGKALSNIVISVSGKNSTTNKQGLVLILSQPRVLTIKVPKEVSDSEKKYLFSRWGDTEKKNPRAIVLDKDVLLKAYYIEISQKKDELNEGDEFTNKDYGDTVIFTIIKINQDKDVINFEFIVGKSKSKLTLGRKDFMEKLKKGDLWKRKK
ncbi:MAG TPA: hypothetical protein VJI68_00585 [Candidatus Nanoarchaeia archaeon]|nr:hypothetical protein [Candidatus Nanoarchaeia archaeon]